MSDRPSLSEAIADRYEKTATSERQQKRDEYARDLGADLVEDSRRLAELQEAGVPLMPYDNYRASMYRANRASRKENSK